MGVFTNLMRQVNAKMPMDLYRITLPDQVRKLSTMFIGIDVCHKGRTSIVGLAATTTPDASQHFCEVKHQLLNRELIGKATRDEIEWDKTKKTTGILCDFVLRALKNFMAKSGGHRPSQIVVFRDGVGGPTFQHKVLELEGPGPNG